MRKCEETETTRTGTAGELLALCADHECMYVFERNASITNLSEAMEQTVHSQNLRKVLQVPFALRKCNWCHWDLFFSNLGEWM